MWYTRSIWPQYPATCQRCRSPSNRGISRPGSVGSGGLDNMESSWENGGILTQERGMEWREKNKENLAIFICVLTNFSINEYFIITFVHGWSFVWLVFISMIMNKLSQWTHIYRKYSFDSEWISYHKGHLPLDALILSLNIYHINICS